VAAAVVTHPVVAEVAAGATGKQVSFEESISFFPWARSRSAGAGPSFFLPSVLE